MHLILAWLNWIDWKLDTVTVQGNSACVHYSGVSSLRCAFTALMHYAEKEYAMPIALHCNDIRALCLTTNTLCRTAEIGALLLKCSLIVYIWPEKGVVGLQNWYIGFSQFWKFQKILEIFNNYFAFSKIPLQNQNFPKIVSYVRGQWLMNMCTKFQVDIFKNGWDMT